MNRRSFFLIIALAVTASTAYGADLHEYCDETHAIFCPKPANYDKHVRSMTKLYDQHKNFISSPDKVGMKDITYNNYNRGDEQNCEQIIKEEQPFAIKSHNTSSSDLVVQLKDQYFVQKIRYTTCRSKQAPCFTMLYTSPDDSPFCCMEQMASVSLYIYDPEHLSMYYKTFDVPVACACKYRSKESKSFSNVNKTP